MRDTMAELTDGEMFEREPVIVPTEGYEGQGPRYQATCADIDPQRWISPGPWIEETLVGRELVVRVRAGRVAMMWRAAP